MRFYFRAIKEIRVLQEEMESPELMLVEIICNKLNIPFRMNINF